MKKTSDGHIDKIEVAGCTLTVSGWIANKSKARSFAISLRHDEIEIGRVAAEAKSGTAKRASKSRRTFRIRTPIPAGLGDLTALTVRAGNRTLQFDGRTAIVGRLPAFAAIADLADAEATLRAWSSAATAANTGAPRRVLFDASESATGIDGIAVDLDCRAHVLVLDLMAGPRRIARVRADQSAAIDLDDGSIAIQRGFSFELARDIGDHTGLWIGLAEIELETSRADTSGEWEAARQADRRSKRVVDDGRHERAAWAKEINRWSAAPAARAKTPKTSLIVDAGTDRHLLDDLLSGIAKARLDLEIVVADRTDVLQKRPAKRARLKVRYVASSGTRAAAYNAAGEAAQCELLLFADPTIRLTRDAVVGLAQQFRAPQLGVAGVRIEEPAPQSKSAHAVHPHSGAHLRPAPGGLLLPAKSTDEIDGAVSADVPVCVPALDGAFLMCPREVFEAVGGFDEKLPDALAVADFCLRVRRDGGREVVSFNDRSVTTIAREAPAPEPEIRHDLSLAQMRAWGAALARRIRRDVFDHPAYWTGRCPVVRFVVPDRGVDRDGDMGAAKRLGRELAAIAPCRVELMPSSAAHDLGGVDLAMVLDPEFDLDKLTGVTPLLTLSAWCRRPEPWRASRWLEAYHIVALPSARAADEFRQLVHAPAVFADSVDDKAFAGDADLASLLPVDMDERSPFTPREILAIGYTGRRRARDLVALTRAAADTALRFAIRPDGGTTGTGPEHVAGRLAAALRRLGHYARVDDGRASVRPLSACDDCVIDLGTVQRSRSTPGIVRVLWLLDRPESASAVALDGYDHVFVASARAAELFAPLTRAPVSELPPATEGALPADGRGARGGIVVVGDGDRRIAALACASEATASFYGDSWKRLVPEQNWRGPLPDDAAARARLYARAEIVVVAVGEAGRRFGHVPQPALDAAAGGAPVIAENLPGIGALLGESVRHFHDDAGFGAAVDGWRNETEAARTQRLAHARILRLRHSYDERAREIAEVARALLSQHLP